MLSQNQAIRDVEEFASVPIGPLKNIPQAILAPSFGSMRFYAVSARHNRHRAAVAHKREGVDLLAWMGIPDCREGFTGTLTYLDRELFVIELSRLMPPLACQHIPFCRF